MTIFILIPNIMMTFFIENIVLKNIILLHVFHCIKLLNINLETTPIIITITPNISFVRSQTDSLYVSGNSSTNLWIILALLCYAAHCVHFTH